MSALWSVAGLIASYAGWTALALAMPRHHGQIWGRQPRPANQYGLRFGGSVLLALAFVACIQQWGLAIGSVAWIGALSASAICFVSLFAFTPHRAAGAALLAVPVAGVLVICLCLGGKLA
jgi:hypothetical protein